MARVASAAAAKPHAEAGEPSGAGIGGAAPPTTVSVRSTGRRAAWRKECHAVAHSGGEGCATSRWARKTRACIDMVVTDLCVLEMEPGVAKDARRFVLKETAPGVTVEEVLAKTTAEIRVPAEVGTVAC